MHNGFDFKQIDKALEDRERGRALAEQHNRNRSRRTCSCGRPELVPQGTRGGDHRGDRADLEQAAHLRVYLNIAEFGRGTAASRPPAAAISAGARPSEPLGCRAARGSAAESIRFRVDAPSRYVRQRQAWIERQMSMLGQPYVSNLIDHYPGTLPFC